MKSNKKKTSPASPPRTQAPRIHARPSIGDPDRIQEFPDVPNLPDLDNETVHKTERPEGPLLEDDDPNDELAEEHLTDRDEDVSESNPLHVGSFVGRKG